jgi:hypothetical protein
MRQRIIERSAGLVLQTLLPLLFVATQPDIKLGAENPKELTSQTYIPADLLKVLYRAQTDFHLAGLPLLDIAVFRTSW